MSFFFFQAEDGIRDTSVTGVRRVLFRSLRLGTPGSLARRAATRRLAHSSSQRSEERRVGKECRSRGSPDHYKKKDGNKGSCERNRMIAATETDHPNAA